MKESINNKLESLTERLEEINHLLSSPEVITEQNKFRALSQEHAQLSPVVRCFSNYKTTLDNFNEAKRMLEDDDKDMREMAKEEFKEAKEQLENGLRLVDEIGATRFEAFLLIYLSRIVLAEDGNRAEALKMINRALEVSRKTGVTFLGPWVLSTLALLSNSPEERRNALSEGQKILDEGCVGHNYIAFYRDAMEVALAEMDWDALDRYAASMEEYTRSEPLPWADFFIARGHALASYGRGKRDDVTMKELARLRNEADRVGLKNAMTAMNEALEAA